MLLGVVLILVGAMSHLEEKALNSSGQLIEANVINWRIHNSRTANNSHEIQFSFTLNSVNYTHSDFLGRSNLWSSLTENHWLETKTTKKILIEYEPDNPWNNRVKGKRSFEDHAVAILAGISWIFLMAFLSKTSKNQKRI